MKKFEVAEMNEMKRIFKYLIASIIMYSMPFIIQKVNITIWHFR